MDIREIRKLVSQGHSVVLLEDGKPPLIVSELAPEEPVPQEVPIIARWPKARVESPERQMRQDEILERLNEEILTLKAQIEQEEVVE